MTAFAGAIAGTRSRSDPPSDGPWRSGLRRLVRHRFAMAGAAVLAALALLAFVGPLLSPYLPDRPDFEALLQGPSLAHPLGTDKLGRDTLARIMAGGRVSLIVAVSVSLCASVGGGLVGLLTGFVGGWRDNAVMRVVDLVQALPRIVPLLVLTKLVPPGLASIVVILLALEWTTAARLVRGMVLSIRAQTYVEAAIAIGCPTRRVLLAHVLPQAVSPLIIEGTLLGAGAIRAEATLSFLGLGIQEPTASWGNMLNNASTYFLIAPLQVYVPGAFIFIALMSLNVLGDGLRDAFDPRARQR